MERMQRLVFGNNRDPREDLAEIFGEPVPEGGDVQRRALDWARLTLAESQKVKDPEKEPVRAVRALRDAEPRLSLTAAKYLMERVVAHQ